MNPIIMVVVAALLLIVAILREIDWKKYAIKWVSPNPQKAVIYHKYNGIVHPYNGERSKDNPLVYSWKQEKEKHSITLPVNYPEEYLASGRRIIGACDKEPVASPLGYMSDSQKNSYSETTVDIALMMESKDVILAMRSINQPKKVNWLMILIIAGVLLVGTLYYQNNIALKQVPVNTSNVTQNQGQLIIPKEVVIP